MGIFLKRLLFTEVEVTCQCSAVHCGKESGAEGCCWSSAEILANISDS